MYRIICNSLKNYAADFNNDITNPRYSPVHFLHLIENVDEYQRQKTENTPTYQRLSSFLWHIRNCQPSEQILHELNFLGIYGAQPAEPTDFTETYRIWQMFLQKAYWRD